MKWGGQRENAGAPSGIKNGMARVPFEQVEEARKEWAERLTMQKLCDKYGVSVNTMSGWLQYNSRVES